MTKEFQTSIKKMINRKLIITAVFFWSLFFYVGNSFALQFQVTNREGAKASKEYNSSSGVVKKFKFGEKIQIDPKFELKEGLKILLKPPEFPNGVWVNAKDGEILLYNESHALVIGVSQYNNGWAKLDGVKKDIPLVEKALTKQGFHVVVVEDPNRDELIKAFESFINKYGRKFDNRLLFYFAGHGHTLEFKTGIKMGYILPKETPNPNRNRGGFLDTAMPMNTIEGYTKLILSKHALFLFDSCFAGTIFSLSRGRSPENIFHKANRVVRQFITAGGEKETVSDASIFREQFVLALNGDGDTDGNGYVTGSELGEFLQKKVINYSKGAQHPKYGKSKNTHFDKGDFIFTLPVNPLAPQAKVNAPVNPDSTLNRKQPGIYLTVNIRGGMKIQKKMLNTIPVDGNHNGTFPANFENDVRGACAQQDIGQGAHLTWKDLSVNCN